MPDAGISPEAVRAFLESYASAFERADKDAVADRYAYPVHVVTHNGGVRLLAIPSREAWIAVVERILGMYSAMGVRRAEMRDLRIASISPLVAQASLVWALRGDGDKPLYDFDATYTVALVDGALKIVQVISENEQPKFMGVMRERG
jgi:ketosteroid isomerase-like protein